VIYERRVADGECKFIFGCNDILKIKRASVCCCRLIKSTNLGLASIIVLQFSIAFRLYLFRRNSSRILHQLLDKTISANTNIQALNPMTFGMIPLLLSASKSAM
jgi:hypothetical protein